jgi:molybdopterin-guanine dinucleotide biosynthesis protein A
MRAALVLAGGEGRRLGGVDKATVDVAGMTMLDRVLSAAAPQCEHLVVVGPARATAVPGVRFTMEPEPGGGPVPAVAAGLELVPDADVVVVLAVDLPALRPEHVAELIAGVDDADVVAAADERGDPNPLLAAYRASALRIGIDGLGSGARAADMMGELVSVVDLGEAGTLNVNRPSDVERARRLLPPAP